MVRNNEFDDWHMTERPFYPLFLEELVAQKVDAEIPACGFRLGIGPKLFVSFNSQYYIDETKNETKLA